MVSFYKHSIVDWRDGTAALSDRAYRVYHVVVEQIYLNEGPIVLHERTLAGLSNRSVRDLRIALQELIEAGKLSLDGEGRITNRRAELELVRVETNRDNAGKGGRTPRQQRATTPREVRDVPGKASISNAPDEAPLQEPESLKDKTRLDEVYGERARTREADRGCEVELRAKIVQAFEQAGHLPPAMHMVGVWLARGIPADLIAEVVCAGVRTGRVKSLSYFERPLADEHDRLMRGARAPPSSAQNHDNVTPLRTRHDPASIVATGLAIAANPPDGYK